MQAGRQFGDWIARRPLGSGGGGEVWLAEREGDGDRGALKVLGADPTREDRARFVREMRALERLQHDAIVRLLDSGFGANAAPWLVMELVEGEDLERRLEAGASIDPAVCAQLFLPLADGLAHAHAQGIHHRDVKASNVIVRPDGRATLVDFGASIDSDATGVTKAGLVLGTFAYMAPEVLTGGTRDPQAADIYAFGQLMQEALTGTLLFRGTGDGPMARWNAAVSEKLQHDALDPGPGVDPRLRRLVRDATAIEPEDRIASMGEVRDRLREIVEGPAAPPSQPVGPEVLPPELDGDRTRRDLDLPIGVLLGTAVVLGGLAAAFAHLVRT